MPQAETPKRAAMPLAVALNGDPADAGEDDCEYFYWAMQDANFNVLAVVDSDGAFKERYEYTPYGERMIFRSRGTNQPDCRTPVLESRRWLGSYPFGLCGIGHQGLYHDKEFNLIYNRARYLSPKQGRFLNRDPLGYVDGMSFYTYCNSSPLNATDPMGLYSPFGHPAFWRSRAGRAIGKSVLPNLRAVQDIASSLTIGVTLDGAAVVPQRGVEAGVDAGIRPLWFLDPAGKRWPVTAGYTWRAGENVRGIAGSAGGGVFVRAGERPDNRLNVGAGPFGSYLGSQGSQVQAARAWGIPFYGYVSEEDAGPPAAPGASGTSRPCPNMDLPPVLTDTPPWAALALPERTPAKVGLNVPGVHVDEYPLILTDTPAWAALALPERTPGTGEIVPETPATRPARPATAPAAHRTPAAGGVRPPLAPLFEP